MNGGAEGGQDMRPKAEARVTMLEGIVASAFGVRRETLRHQSRGSAEAAFARQVAMYLAHTRLGLPLSAVAAIFERDRTTARYGCRRVEERRDDPRVDSILDYLERAVDCWPDFIGGGRA